MGAVAAVAMAPPAQSYSVTSLGSLGFGEVRGFDLRKLRESPELVERVRADTAKHRLLVFKGQDDLSGEEHVAICDLFGSMDHGLHSVHPKAPHPYLLRVSNDEAEGFKQIGVSGWHIDGVMIRLPFSLQTMHFLNAIPGGDTRFLAFDEFLRRVRSERPELAERWERLFFLSGVGDDLMAGDGQLAMHPLVTALEGQDRMGMCFHLGASYCLGWIREGDGGEAAAPAARKGLFSGMLGQDPVEAAEEELGDLLKVGGCSLLEPKGTLKELSEAIDEFGEECSFQQAWEDGDFAFIDNRALAHVPVAGTQADASESGLRLFHRTTITQRDSAPPVAKRSGRPSFVLSGGIGKPMPAASGGADLEDLATLRRVLRGIVAVRQA